jgi:hypothetical protein
VSVACVSGGGISGIDVVDRGDESPHGSYTILDGSLEEGSG